MNEPTQKVAQAVAAALAGQSDAEFVAVGLPRALAEDFVSQIDAVSFNNLPEEYYTSTEAASALGVSRPTLMKLVDHGDIGFVKVGSHYRFPVEEVEAYKRLQSVSRSRATATWNELASAHVTPEGSNVTFGARDE